VIALISTDLAYGGRRVGTKVLTECIINFAIIFQHVAMATVEVCYIFRHNQAVRSVNDDTPLVGLSN
jgi:hypothetical protein